MEERLDRSEQRLDQHGELIAELRAATLANSQRARELQEATMLNSQRIGELQEATVVNSQNLDRLANIGERFVTVVVDAVTELRGTTVRLDQAVEELRASNRRQQAINDYLIRKDRERGNGNSG
ncbi:hypothetical protein [Gloeobacter morelensis]|uniref:Uncharacterized protein n=1 Tax=Gloeobacter morelensis MG652769 TaxID=2781736 RepID=A0ABY3PLN1_9CYAN|nr:hypothetical protein [Gloeobacter morelensis]UFP94586.1 hypothetical protein ISF26_23100 [Gloeobacter morelensis MG652769]